MIKKNSNLRRQINLRVQNQPKQNDILSNDLSHPLLLSIKHYRKQVTSLAIDCLKQHNRSSMTLDKPKGLKNNYISIDKENRPISQKTIQNINHVQPKSAQTKKKKYNYYVGDQFDQASGERTQQTFNQRYNTIGLSHLNQLSNDHVRNCKSSSLVCPKSNHYITAPFVLDTHQDHRSQKRAQEQSLPKPKHQEAVNIKKLHQNYNQSHLASKQITRSQKSDTKMYSKSSLNLQHNKKSKNLKNVSIGQQEKLTYPKTQTYTSRSEYNIEKLKNKLDFYIKKHIHQPL